MKKYLLIGLLLSSSFVCYAADLTLYKNVQLVKALPVTQPAIVEITNLDQAINYTVVNDTNQVIPQQFQTERNRTIIPPQQVVACMATCVNAPALADSDERTTFDFPLTTSGIQRGSIKIVYAKPLETDSVTFRTTGDSYMPRVFTLTIDGKRILNTTQGSSARFPKMMAQTVVIEFEYDQPIRFSEVGVGSVIDEGIVSMLRFVYQPSMRYMVYSSSSVRDIAPSPAINLFGKNKEATLTLEEIHKNPLYKENVYIEKDTDGDTILDIHDNCPLQVNPDQKDSNGNGIGDVCDDYDYDGVPTYMDNCPQIENPYQEDKDRDGIGDVCDAEESRVTEKYPWISWVVFITVFAGILAMGYEVVTMKKENERKIK